MAANDLTTLANVKAYPNMSGIDADDLLTRLITSASTFIQRWTDRDLIQQTYTETRSGKGGNALVLSQFPVTAIASVMVDGNTIGQRTDPAGSGWIQDGRQILLSGYTFTRGTANVVVQYTAGYAPGTIPFDVEQSCIELVVLAFRQRTRIGDQSKTIAAGGGHETVSYFMQAMTPSVKAVLEHIRDVVPL